MKKLIALCLFSLSLFAQTIATPLSQTVTSNAPSNTTTVNTATLPGMTIGVGPAWNRGNTNPVSIDTTVAFRLSATSNIYSWTDIVTPYVQGNTGSAVASTLTTGLAYAVAQNKTGSVSLLAIVQAGLAASTAGTSPAFTGSIAAAFKLGKKNIYVVPYFKAGNPTLGSNGAVASFVMQPGIQVMYGFGR